MEIKEVFLIWNYHKCLGVYGHNTYFYSYSAGIDFRRLKRIPMLKGLNKSQIIINPFAPELFNNLWKNILFKYRYCTFIFNWASTTKYLTNFRGIFFGLKLAWKP